MKRFLEQYLKIYSPEVSRFIWLAAIFFTIFFVTAIFRNYVDTAFLKRFGPEYIPWMLVISALLTMVVLNWADRFARRYSDPFLLSGFLAIYAIGSALCFLMVKAQLTIVYPILYQLMGLLDALLLVYLWNIAGDLFDARQGKRIFPLITASQVLGSTIGSFSTRPITFAIGEDAALLIFGAVFLVTAGFLATSSRKVVGATAPSVTGVKTAPVKKPLSEIPGLMKQFPIVKYLIICGLLPNVLLPIFSYQFSVIANDTFASEQSLITFLSMFRGMTTLITFVVLLFVGRVYTRMGLPNASLVHPINFTILFSGLAAFFNIYVAAYGQFSVIMIQRAIAGPVNKILYSVIPKELQAWSRTFIRGTVLKIGMLIGSLTMIVLKPVLEPRGFAYIAMVVAAYWVYETLIFRKEYKRILRQVIVEDKIDFDQVEAVRTFDAGGAPMGLESQAVDVPSAELVEDSASVQAMDPELALRMLDDPSLSARAEAAASFRLNPDMRAAGKLIRCLEGTEDKLRDAALEALIAYPADVLPFLEASLTRANLRGKQGILEVIRLSPILSEFEMTHLLSRSVEEAYGNLLVIRQLESRKDLTSVNLLLDHLKARNDEILRLLFYALWVFHDDMRLMYQALKSDTAAVAVEMVETSIRGGNVPYLLPLIDDVPLNEKIEKGRKLFALVENDTPERLLALLAQAQDAVTRMLAAYAMGEMMPNPAFVPILASLQEDEDAAVSQVAEFASARGMNKETKMPEILDIIKKLKDFDLFEGMGTRELHAVATISEHMRLKKDDIVVRAGEENHSIYLILSGNITIYSDYGTPNQKEVRSSGAGQYFNFAAMFLTDPPINTSVVTQETEAYVIQQSQFHEIMRVYPQIGMNLLAIAARLFRNLGVSV
jgi:ATP/ADP translocase